MLAMPAGSRPLTKQTCLCGEYGPWYPDPLIPLDAAFNLPAADNGVPRQRVQPVFVDIYIPHDAAPGPHQGAIAVRAGGRLIREVAVEVDVLPFTLPDQLN